MLMQLLPSPVSAIFLYAIAAAAMLFYLAFILVSYARARVGYDLYAPVLCLINCHFMLKGQPGLIRTLLKYL